MVLNRKHFRAIIFYNFRRGLTQQQCIDELNSIFGDKAPSRTSVYRWYGEFNRDRGLLQDEFREGRPKLVVVPETIDGMRQPLETTLGISKATKHSILHEHLTEKNLFALDPTQFVNRSKKGSCRLVERKYVCGASKHVYDIET